MILYISVFFRMVKYHSSARYILSSFDVCRLREKNQIRVRPGWKVKHIAAVFLAQELEMLIEPIWQKHVQLLPGSLEKAHDSSSGCGLAASIQLQKAHGPWFKHVQTLGPLGIQDTSRSDLLMMVMTTVKWASFRYSCNML